MRSVLLALVLSGFAPPLLAQGAPPQAAPDQPYTMEYYYKTQWGHQQEFLQKASDAPHTVCTKCGKETFSKMLTAAGFQLKGSGWYVTDFRDGGAKKDAKPAESKPAEAKPGDATAAQAKPAEAKPAESKSEPAPAPAAPATGSGS